jgi:SAM-dependent methyltransferase
MTGGALKIRKNDLPIGTEIAESSTPTACPACGGWRSNIFFSLAAVPVNCVALWPTREAARQCPTRSIHLAFCADCGAIFNQAFESALLQYDTSYDNSLHFSPSFQQYSEDLVEYLIRQYDLHGKDIVEIGCGKGEFLAMLCRNGDNRGLGFDPSYVDGRADTRAGQGFRVIHDYYSDAYINCPVDFVCCRQVLEHIPNPRYFLASIRGAIGNRSKTGLFFEVPNVLFTFRQMGIWDIIYEHCVYYTPTSLQRLFVSSGFEAVNTRESFGGQYLWLEARPITTREKSDIAGDPGELGALTKDVEFFSDNYRRKIEHWKTTLESIARSGQRAVLWGAGAKGATFLNAMRDHSEIEYVVDINPHKLGRFVPGTGQKVVLPEFLVQCRPQFVFITNPNYEHEILRRMTDLGLGSVLTLV